MSRSVFIRKNLYKDSVALMRIAEVVRGREHVLRVTLLMGTPANKAILASAGLFSAELDAAKPGDVMVVVDAETSEARDAAMNDIASRLEGERPAQGAGETAPIALRSIGMARAHADGAFALAQVSVPGPYAAAEAMKALRQGLHVFLFSDNVPIEQERAIKKVAHGKGLLVMGPDCGTAIIGGTPLGFANVVRRGSISLVGASGTGLQEASCQIHALGHGIRHAIGTGGHDVSAEIGGATMGQALDLLAADPLTRIIGIVSKPPAPTVAREILARVAAIGKPVVVLFLGADLSNEKLPSHVVVVTTLYDVAVAAVALAEGRRFVPSTQGDEWLRLGEAEAGLLAPSQRYVRGLYSGGTFCSEAQLVWAALGLRVQSNAPVDKAGASGDDALSRGHTAVDLGDDEYTVGRPHPMIDPSGRIESIVREARDPTTAVIVLDVVLGYAAHDDPAGALAPAIEEAKAACKRDGRHLSVVSFVCGTEEDPQRLSGQQARLRKAGALVLPSHTSVARLAGQIGLRAAARAAKSGVSPGT